MFPGHPNLCLCRALRLRADSNCHGLPGPEGLGLTLTAERGPLEKPSKRAPPTY